MRKLWVVLTVFLLTLTLSACNMSETPANEPDPAIPEVDEVEAQNFGWVPCADPDRGRLTCLGLEYRDGFGHSWGHYERTWVRSLQDWLNRRGFRDDSGRSLEVDGYFGSRTLQAVYRAQRKHDLIVDGDVGLCTWTALFHDSNALYPLCHQE